MFRLTQLRPILRVGHTLESSGKVQYLDEIVFHLKQMNKRLEALSGGIALSNEQEVTQAVKKYLRCSSFNIKDIKMPRLLQIPFENNKYLKADADGIILSDAYLCHRVAAVHCFILMLLKKRSAAELMSFNYQVKDTAQLPQKSIMVERNWNPLADMAAVLLLDYWHINGTCILDYKDY
ncbi:hypothetical protein MP228_002279 [Amoeboaphelidium protococcarum]|nr:hypothetical protein MP228_002279 [Amoeboaphelidium protococcarum]